MESKITRNKQVLAEAGSQPWLEAVCVCLFPPYWRTKPPLLPSMGTQAALPLASLLPINPVHREKRIERGALIGFPGELGNLINKSPRAGLPCGGDFWRGKLNAPVAGAV
ncbi:unnamed protein product [Boreogadus saida]